MRLKGRLNSNLHKWIRLRCIIASASFSSSSSSDLILAFFVLFSSHLSSENFSAHFVNDDDESDSCLHWRLWNCFSTRRLQQCTTKQQTKAKIDNHQLMWRRRLQANFYFLHLARLQNAKQPNVALLSLFREFFEVWGRTACERALKMMVRDSVDVSHFGQQQQQQHISPPSSPVSALRCERNAHIIVKIQASFEWLFSVKWGVATRKIRLKNALQFQKCHLCKINIVDFVN